MGNTIGDMRMRGGRWLVVYTGGDRCYTFKVSVISILPEGGGGEGGGGGGGLLRSIQ